MSLAAEHLEKRFKTNITKAKVLANPTAAPITEKNSTHPTT